MERELEVLNMVAGKKGIPLNIFFKRSIEESMKSCESSEKHRKAGDDLLEKPDEPKDHKCFLAFEQYCKSILCAPKDSEQLALGYKSRSDLLFRISEYKDCLKNVDFALEITNKSQELEIELLRRKAECLQKLEILKEDNIFKDVESSISLLDDAHKKMYSDLLKESMTLIVENPKNSSNENYSSDDDTENISDRVQVKYDKKTGQHLEAARDYKVGDLILVEKSLCFATSPTTDWTNCNYCLKTAWSGIPCENCNKAIFCSKECKDKAHELYHDVECLILPHVAFPAYFHSNLCYVKLCLRAVIISMKKAGSIAELRNKIELVCENSDPCLRGVFSNGKYHGDLTDFVYPLDSELYKMKPKLENQSSKVLEILICFIKHTKIFRQFPYRTIDILVHDDNLMFIGSLILRLVIIVGNHNPYIFSSKIKNCEFGQGSVECMNMLCCYNGMSLNSLTSTMNDVRSRNASICCTENNEIIIFAVLPIKKGDRLSVGRESHTYLSFKAEKKESCLKDYYSDTFFSDPSARKNWRGFLSVGPLGSTVLMEISYDFSQIFDVFLRYMIIKGVDRQLGKEDLERISKAITDLVEKSPQAKISTLMDTLTEALGLAITHLYGMKPFWDDWNSKSYKLTARPSSSKF